MHCLGARWGGLFPLALLAVCLGCGGGSNTSSQPVNDPPPQQQQVPDTQSLTAAEVQSVINAAAAAANDPFVIAVTDRAGRPLAVFRKTGAPATAIGNFSVTVDANDLAVNLARTAAFFSNDQAPLSSRTVRYLSGIHFPPGIANTENAPLYGIENTNRGCKVSDNFAPGKSLPQPLTLGGMTGLGMITGKVDVYDSNQTAVNPGGVPIYKNGDVAGGVGVVGSTPDVSEYAAYTAATGAAATNPELSFLAVPAPGAVVINGITVPFVVQTTIPAGFTTDPSFTGIYFFGPVASAAPVPNGYLVNPQAGPIGGLSAAEVASIVTNAINTASVTRAVIRLPIGQRTRMVISVADLDGTLLALYRMPDATVFSVDVSVAKSRNMTYFNSAQANPADLPGVPVGTAVTNRTIGFGAQPLYPPGIDSSPNGPFFQLFVNDVQNPCTQGSQPPGAKQSGIVFFPGSEGIYRNGVLVGGLGVSGDGVDQDDYVTSGGDAGYEPPTNIRADQIIDQGVRLPYLKFPRNPTD
jgi:uncharacterized protein GlcG (DUF336 family)